MRERLNKFSYYLVTFFMSVLIGMFLIIICDLPLKFLRIVHMDLVRFIIHFLGTCIALYVRSYSRSYHANTRTYTFSLKTALLSIGAVFLVQVLLVVILGVKNGGHAIYIAGPSRSLANYVLSLMNPSSNNQYAMYCQLNWTFMILLDIFVFAPIMILGEYWGAKQHQKDLAFEKSQKPLY